MMQAVSASDQDIRRVEQFYYREARFLDERQFQQWLGLLDPAIEYLMPSRHVPVADAKAKGTEAFLAVDKELERRGPAASPLRSERFPHLAIRAARPFKVNAWAESPAPRTRRLISNVEVEPIDDGRLRAFSNFHLFYSQDGADNHHYVGCRRDILNDKDGIILISSREVIIDWNIVTGPTLGLLF